ncbi:MAG: hypothetical protein IBJ07_12365 [Rhizobiaceae bacterium]|nr:hypothetical protein [Rhizobiaceae bacterium]
MTQLVCEEYFGGCPHCGTARWANVGRVHWCYCPEHEVRWCVGENLISSWRDEDESIWQRNVNMLEGFPDVEPLLEGEPIPMAADAKRAVDELFSRVMPS